MAELLRDSFGFEVELLTGPEQTTRRALQQVLDRLPAKENLLLYFSGHGGTDGFGLSYWVPSDGLPDDYGTWIYHEMVQCRVARLLARVTVRHILIISDSCYAGGLLRDSPRFAVSSEQWPAWIAEKYGKPSIQVLVSGGMHPVVGDTGCHDKGRSLGFFCCALQEALQQPGREVWTASELVQEVTAMMKGVRLEDGSAQVPDLGHLDDAHVGGGEFVLIRRSGAAAPTGPAGSTMAELTVRVKPAAARVLVDGHRIEAAAAGGRLVVFLTPGTHRVEADLAGFTAAVRDIELAAGTRRDLQLELSPLTGPTPVRKVITSGFGILYVKSQPTGAEVLVDGRPVGTRTPATLEDLAAGNRRLTLRLDRYHDWTGHTEVVADEVRQVVAELQPAFGELVVRSEPTDALLYVDGRQVGVTQWSNPEQPSGRYQLRLVKACFEDLRTEAVIRDGTATRLDLTMRPSCGDLRIVTQPPGATVLVDGKTHGSSPVRLTDLPEGEHRVRLTLALHEQRSRLVEVIGGESRTLELQLQPTYGEVEITTQPPGAEVVAEDGRVLGGTPFLGRFEAGVFIAALRKEGYAEKRVSKDLLVGETVGIDVTLRRLKGNLTVLTEPAEAELWVDGNRVGHTPTTVRDLPTGEHQLVAKKGYLEANTKVVVVGNQTRTERLEMVPSWPLLCGPGVVVIVDPLEHRAIPFSGSLAAEEAALALRDGTVLWFCSGRHKLTRTVRIRNVKDVEIRGMAVASLELNADDKVLSLQDVDRVTIADLHLVHKIGRPCRDGCLSVWRSTEVVIQGNNFEGSGYYGIGLIDVSDAVIIDNVIHDCGYGLSIEGSCKDLLIRGNLFENNRWEHISVYSELSSDDIFVHDPQSSNTFGASGIRTGSYLW